MEFIFNREVTSFFQRHSLVYDFFPCHPPFPPSVPQRCNGDLTRKHSAFVRSNVSRCRGVIPQINTGSQLSNIVLSQSA